MDGFNLSFKNKRVKMWFLIVMPIVLLAILLFIILPREYHLLPTLLPLIGIIIYFGWLGIDRKNQK